MKRYIAIDMVEMNKNNLSMLDWALLENILFLSNNEFNSCATSKEKLRTHLGVSNGQIYKTIEKLIENGYLKKLSNGYLKVTEKWLKISSGDTLQKMENGSGDTLQKMENDSPKNGDLSYKIELRENTYAGEEDKSEESNEINEQLFSKLNSYQKIELLQSKLNKHIGIVKTKIFRDDMFVAKEFVEQIEDPNDFVSAYVEHKKSLKDKKYLKGMFAFMAEYVDGGMKSAKKLEDDYAITIHDEWQKLDDGNFAMLNGHVIDPFTGKIIPGYWDKQARL